MAITADELTSTIEAQMEQSQGYANAALASALELASTLQTTIDDIDSGPRLGFSTINAVIPDSNVDPNYAPGNLDVSGVFSPGFSLPTVVLRDIDPVRGVTFKDFSEDAPAIAFPARPDSEQPVAPDSPTVSLPSLPSSPNLSLPDVVEVDSIEIPEMPDYPVVAAFEGELPSLDVSATIPVMAYSEDEYQSDLKDAAEAWLQSQVENGGTGLAPAVEQALYDRAVTREVDTARGNIEAAADEFAAAGFSRPPGSLRARQAAIRVDLQNRLDDLNKDILIEQARLAQTNTHFAITSTLQFESMMLQHFNSVANRAFELAKSVVTIAIETYNARVLEYNARLEAYKSAATVHEILVRASLLELEQYKTVLEGKQIQANIQRTEVENYRSQVEAANSLAQLYATQLQASKIEADIEAMKIEIFRAEVAAYSSLVQAKEAEWAAYRAGIDGERAKVEVFAAQVDAFKSETSAKVAQMEGEKTRVEADVAIEQLRLEQVKNQISIYIADLEKQKALIETQLSAYLAKNDAFKADISRAQAQANVNIEAAKLQQEAYKYNASVSNNKFQIDAAILAEQVKTKISGAAQGANAMTNAASAALSQISSITSALGSAVIE